MIKRMLLRGAPRSGTHLATQWLIEKHFPMVDLDTTRRHRLVDFGALDSDTTILACIKHPMSWLVSMHRFVLMSATEGPVVVDGIRYQSEIEFPRFVEKNPVLFDYWNVANLNWRCLGAIFVNYERVVGFPADTVVRVGEDLDLPIPREITELPEFTLQGGKPMNFAYYREEHWRKVYDLGTWWAARDSLDPRLTFDFDLTWR